jgi:hypothetical protein
VRRPSGEACLDGTPRAERPSARSLGVALGRTLAAAMLDLLLCSCAPTMALSAGYCTIVGTVYADGVAVGQGILVELVTPGGLVKTATTDGKGAWGTMQKHMVGVWRAKCLEADVPFRTVEGIVTVDIHIGEAPPTATPTNTRTPQPTITPWYTYAPTPTPGRLVFGFNVAAIAGDGERPVSGVTIRVDHEDVTWAIGLTDADGWYQLQMANELGWWTVCPTFPSGVVCDKIIRPEWLIYPRPDAPQPTDPCCIRFKVGAGIPQVTIKWRVFDERATATPSVVPTATPTNSSVPVPTCTRTHVPTDAPTVAPTRTSTVAATDTATRTPSLVPTGTPMRTSTPAPTLTWRQHIALAQQLLAEIMPGWRIRIYLELDGIGVHPEGHSEASPGSSPRRVSSQGGVGPGYVEAGIHPEGDK